MIVERLYGPFRRREGHGYGKRQSMSSSVESTFKCIKVACCDRSLLQLMETSEEVMEECSKAAGLDCVDRQRLVLWFSDVDLVMVPGLGCEPSHFVSIQSPRRGGIA